MNKVLEYFNKLNNEELINKKIQVAGWKFNYDYKLVSSVTPYLFEELNITENIAKKENENRDGRVKDKVYITVHDTGDTIETHDAKFWSDTVYNEKWMDTEEPYKASFQYVVGNDGIYHNIPDNEVAYHAGDSTKFDYKLYSTGVKPSDKCDIDIDSEGYFTINGERTKILAPKKELEDGSFELCTVNDINDQGLAVAYDDNEFYIGEVYVNKTYQKIANRGGNNNSIGIESCVNLGSDIYLTMQRLAKLVAHLLEVNNLDIYDVKQHHYFSGKNCPQTMRENDLWNHFLHLVEVEQMVNSFIKEGYTIKLIPLTNYVSENGRIEKLPRCVKGIEYTIQTIKDDEVEEYTFYKLV